MVAVAFPQYFPVENVVRAKEAVKRWQPEAWAEFALPNAVEMDLGETST